MKEVNGHIISSLSWNTSFDKKDMASELQSRISSWSKTTMQKEINTVFDRLCPDEQTWRIKSLELDLGVVNYNELEADLSKMLCQQLTEKLIELVLYSNKGSANNIEIFNEDHSQISLIKEFLLHGIMPWNYKSENGSVNQMMAFQLQNNKQQATEMLWEVGTTHENIRKRMAWQLNEPTILQIIKVLEPNNHFQIIDFSNELVFVQKKENIVQTNITDFKKNVWLWVLNYLFMERGTIYNKVAFLKSSIRQMANHYNVGYNALFELIERAVAKVNQRLKVKPQFMQALIMLADENKSLQKDIQTEEKTIDYWHTLKLTFQDPSLRKTKSQKRDFNELVISLYKEDISKFATLITSIGDSEKLWISAIADLNTTSLETIFFSLTTAKSPKIIESIYFLHQLCKEINIHVEQKMLWGIGMQFILQHKNSSFNNTEFLSFCITELSKSNQLSNRLLIEQLVSTEVTSSARTISSYEIYATLNSIYLTEISTHSPVIVEDSLKELLDNFNKEIVRGRLNSSLFLSLQKSIIKRIQTNPKAALEVLLTHPDKEILFTRLLPSLNEHSIYLLATQSKNELSIVTSAIQNSLATLKADINHAELIDLINENLFVWGLKALILNPKINAQKLFETIFKHIAESIKNSEWEQFSNFIEVLTNSKETNSLKISPDFFKVLKESSRYNNKYLSVKRVVHLILESPNKQVDIEKMLTAQFPYQEFIKWKKTNKEIAAKLLTHLSDGGKRLMQELIMRYKTILTSQLSNIQNYELDILLDTLYWKCILNYANHQGNSERIKSAFREAILYHFDISGKITPFKIDKQKEITHHLNGGYALSSSKLYLLIQKGLTECLEEIVSDGKSFQLSELMELGLELNSTEIRRILSKTTITEKRIRLLSAITSFRQLNLWVISTQPGQMGSVPEAMRLLYDMVVHLTSGQVSQKIFENYFSELWKGIKTNSWPIEGLKMLIQESIVELSKDANKSIDLIILDIKNGDVRLTPLLKRLLQECYPVFSLLDTNKLPEATNGRLADFEHKGLLDNLIYYLTTQKQVPSWLGYYTPEESIALLNQTIVQHPLKVFQALKQHAISERQISWLNRSVDFKALINSIGYLNKTRETQLGILEEFYYTLGKISVPGISADKLQSILFSKILTAWIHNNWKIISIENIWNELLWDIFLKYGVSKQEFLSAIENGKHILPPSIQISLENIREQDKISTSNELPEILKPAKKITKKDILLTSDKKKGIAVRNAGIVLLNSYIGILFERLGFIENKVFVNETIQADAVHYIQYIITGLTSTEESLLPLNKVLCGLPLNYPVKSGFAIPDAHKRTIESLINAAIAYWPAIGNTSINGFRGNWLVRDGVLTEKEERWELTIEKRAYDILIHKSPFSFSIIKHTWMEKPIHVIWPY